MFVTIEKVVVGDDASNLRQVAFRWQAYVVEGRRND